MMQLRIPFLPSERRKPCSVGELVDEDLFDEDMIFVQCVSGDVVAFQIMQVHVGPRGNWLFRGSDRYTTLVYFFSGPDIAGGNFVSDADVLGEDDFAAIDDGAVPGPYGRNHDEHIVIAMNSQQLS